MTDSRRIARKTIGVLVIGPLAMALTGCISLTPDPPESLLTLTPSSIAGAGEATTSSTGATLAVMEFEAPARLNVTRVPVQVDATELAYLKDAVWVEKPSRLFRRLVAETIRARSNRVVLDGGDPPPGDVARLEGTLREFGYDVATSSVVVRFDAMRKTTSGTIQQRRFEARTSGVLPESAPVGAALNAAANDVAIQVADWVG